MSQLVRYHFVISFKTEAYHISDKQPGQSMISKDTQEMSFPVFLWDSFWLRFFCVATPKHFFHSHVTRLEDDSQNCDLDGEVPNSKNP